MQLCGPTASTPMTTTSDSAGGAIVVWEDSRISPGSIYAQRVNGSGVLLWTDGGVCVDGSVGPGALKVVDDGENGAIVVWGPSSTGASIAIQRLSADGVPLWGDSGLELRPLVGNPPLDNHPVVVGDAHGGAIVAWTANVVVSGPLDTLIACRVDSSGTKRWETTVRIDTMDVAPPCLCPDGLGGVILAWQEYEAGVRHVRVQRVDSAGAIRWDVAGVRACTLSTTQAARACLDVGDRFIVGWFGGAGVWQHRAQMFDVAGNQLWGQAGVPVSGGFSSSSASVGLSSGIGRQSVWAWEENRSGADDIFAQKLDSSGGRHWDTTGIWVGTTDTVDGYPFSATGDGRGGAITAWPLFRTDRNSDVHAQHVDSAGHLCWSDTGLAVCQDTDNQRRTPAVISDGNGGAIIVWTEWRWGEGSALCAQRVVDVAWVDEAPNVEVRAMEPGSTVVKGVLRLEVDSRQRAVCRAELLDAAGRKVAVLHKGANDVGGFAPGVYFVKAESRVTSHKQVARVVITR